MASNTGHGITSSDRMVWYNVGQILLGSGKCLANCMNTYSLASLMSRTSTTALCMPFLMQSVTPARQCRFTLIVQHLTVCSYLKPPDTMIILLSLALSVWFPFDRLLPISIKCDVTPIKMLFTLNYTFYKKSISQVFQKVPLPDGFPSATTRA